MPSLRSSANLRYRRSLGLVAIDGVVNSHVAVAIVRHAEAQGERFAGGGAAVAFLGRKLAHSGIEQPRPCAPDFSLSPVWAG